MKRSALIGTIAAGALVIGGVGTAIAVSQLPEAAPTPSVSITAEETPEATPEGLVAETPSPVATDSAAADEAFLAYVAAELPPVTTIADATDEELIAAGHEACEVVESGVAWEDIRLVEGEQPTDAGYYMDTSAILNGALYNYCPELIPDLEND